MKIKIAKVLCAAAVSLNMMSAATIAQLPANALIEASSAGVRSDDGFKPALPKLKPVASTEADEKTEVKNSPMFEGLGTYDAEKLVEESTTPSLPAAFDLRDVNRSTPVADLSPYGTCWSFGAIASAESDLLDLYPGINLSELHTAYFPFSGNGLYEGDYLTEKYYSGILELGGSVMHPINIWSQWIGPVYDDIRTA